MIIERNEALFLGKKRYFTGKPCKHGHIAERLVSNRSCVICSKIRLKLWQIENPDKVRKLDRDRHNRDREKRNALQRQAARKNVKLASERKRLWCEKNRDKALEIQNRWNKKNRHKINAYAANRRSIIHGAGKHTGQDIKNIYEHQAGLCAGCRAVLGKWHVDHIIALSKGGKNTPDNLQLLCKRCNLKKHTKSMEEFIASLRVKENG